MKRTGRIPLLAAIDIGSNAVRLEIARLLPDGSLETVHQQRDPIRPGEGVFATGVLSREVALRLLSTMRRYAALCQRDGARVRAVATSAIREARNGPEVVRRIRDETGIDVEVVSGREEARLICLGVLQGKSPRARSLVLDIGGGSTEVANAVGQEPGDLWSVSVGAVRLTEMFDLAGRVPRKRLGVVRSYATEAFREGLPPSFAHPAHALGSSGTINAVVGYAGRGRTATRKEIGRAAEALAEMSLEARRRRFDARRAEVIVAGAVILDALVQHLRLDEVTSVDTGLRDGVLVDLVRRAAAGPREDHSAADAAVALGRRFGFDERHGIHVGALATTLFEDLASLHGLPFSARRILEAAAVVHDIGNAVSHQKHHKHTFYLVANADMPGFSDRERLLVATVARYHRRSTPSRTRPDLADLAPGELSVVRRLAALVRVANALDASHQQPVRAIRAGVRDGAVVLDLRLGGAADLELWEVDREAQFFREVYRKRLDVVARKR